MKNFLIKERYLRDFFDIGIILKGIDGLLEVIGGIFLLVIKPGSLNHIASALTQYELVEDPNDKIANYILHATNLTEQAKLFGAIFLLSHGVIKIFLIGNLLKNKLWAYPSAIIIFSLFGIYQIYVYALTGSVGMLTLTVLDFFVVILTWHEYKFLKSSR